MASLPPLGDRLARRRSSQGLSLRQAAALIGCAQSSLSRIEAGTQQPTPDLLVKISTMLGLDLRELYELAGHAVPDDLPDLKPYMRMKYKNLPPLAFREIETFIGFLHAKYHVSPNGPGNGGDETPEGASQSRHSRPA